MILHVRKNALLRPVRSISDQFWSLLGTIFDPKTLQNGLRDPIEKSTKFWNPFFEFWTIFGRFWSPKWTVKFTPTTFFRPFWPLRGVLGPRAAPGRPRDPIFIDLGSIVDRFFSGCCRFWVDLWTLGPTICKPYNLNAAHIVQI
jgi:hypothetical protein